MEPESFDIEKLIPDGSTVCLSGFVGMGTPDVLSAAIEDSFLRTGHPRDLTLVYCAGNGDRKGMGADHFAHEGLLRRVVAGHYAFAPVLQKLINDNKVEAYNLPQGTLTELLRDTAGGRPGTVTKIGMGTFVDPANAGGKLNARTTEDLVSRITIDGEDWLLYKRIPIDVALIRATTADTNGNLSREKEAACVGVRAQAQAAHNSGGRVIAQVERLTTAGSLDPRQVKVSGFIVDDVVVTGPDKVMQTAAVSYEPAFSGEVRMPLETLKPLPLDKRKVIARRAFLELVGGGGEQAVVNLGIGIPEGIAAVAEEEGAASMLKLTVESGVTGGIPQSGDNFGASMNPDAIFDEAQEFDFYDGGGLDCTFIGLAQMDSSGNVNVSKFGPKIAGCGGAINITQPAKRVVFCGTFTAAGLKEEVSGGELHILHEGSVTKLLADVEQVTFSGDFARAHGQSVLYVTERAVFELTSDGVVLTEIAPGVDLEKDVLAQMEFRPIIADTLRSMDPHIFVDGPMGTLEARPLLAGAVARGA